MPRQSLSGLPLFLPAARKQLHWPELLVRSGLLSQTVQELPLPGAAQLYHACSERRVPRQLHPQRTVLLLLGLGPVLPHPGNLVSKRLPGEELGVTGCQSGNLVSERFPGEGFGE